MMVDPPLEKLRVKEISSAPRYAAAHHHPQVQLPVQTNAAGSSFSHIERVHNTKYNANPHTMKHNLLAVPVQHHTGTESERKTQNKNKTTQVLRAVIASHYSTKV